MIRRFLALVFVVTMSHTAWASSVEANLSSQVLLLARLSGSKVVPAVQTQAEGLVAVLLNFQKDSAFITGTVTGMTSAITGIHLHRGRAGENGDVVLDLSSSLQGDVVAAATKLSSIPPAVIAAALKGELYVAVHTMLNPGGELRGQLEAETDVQLSAMLSGEAQVRQDGKKLRIWAVFSGTAQVTAAHLHRGASGTNGDVVADLSGMIRGNTIVGELDASSFVEALLRGEVYMNIHTSAYPNGELRGQLSTTARTQLAFEVWLDGAQQVPPISTMARGVGKFWLSASVDTLWWDIYADGLSSTITGVHLHRGAVGASGDVLLDLSASVQQNGWIRGSSTSVSSALIAALLSGQVYVNIHTANNPNGEIRGQVWRLLREGFVASFDGQQQVPPVTTLARGTGIVSIDRTGSSLHYEFVLNGVVPQAVHFHKGKRGENGDVLFDLSSSFSAVAMAGATASGYWTAEDMPAFDAVTAELFFRDSVYVNVHSALYPNGECRGQVTRQYAPMGISTADNGSQQPVQLSPNPVETTMWIRAESAEGSLLAWRVFTLRGETVLEGTAEYSAGGYMVDVSSLPSGVYLLQMTFSSSNRRALPFVKQ